MSHILANQPQPLGLTSIPGLLLQPLHRSFLPPPPPPPPPLGLSLHCRSSSCVVGQPVPPGLSLTSESVSDSIGERREERDGERREERGEGRGERGERREVRGEGRGERGER